MFERYGQPLLSRREFIRRQLTYLLAATGIIIFSIILGMLGYHYLESLSWLDATLNASMILTGMGPVNKLNTEAGKVFASLYALYSGVIFLLVVGVILAPLYHRFLHRFHLAAKSADDDTTDED